MQVPEFGSQNYFTAEIGFLSRINETITMGAHIYSPFATTITDEDEIPTSFRIGPRVKISDQLILYAEIEKIEDLSPIFKSALAYQIPSGLAINLGVIPSESEYTIGFKYSFQDSFSVHGAMLYDNILGSTPSAAIHYYKKNNR